MFDIPDSPPGQKKGYRALSPLAEDILGLLRKHRHLSTASLEFLTGKSRTAVKNTLQKLLREDYVVMHGPNHRSVVYTLPEVSLE